ncbi:MAG: diguanylate cyclase domain-containing protein [bacterium]
MKLTDSFATSSLGRLGVLALIVVALSGFATLPSMLELGETAVKLWFLLAWITVPLLAGLACRRAAATSVGSDHRAWQCFGLGCLLWLFGIVTWAGHGWTGAVPTFPGPADIFFSLTNVTFMWGIYHYSLEGSGGSRIQVTNFALAVFAMIAIGFIAYFPVFVESQLGPLGTLVALSYPVAWIGTFAFCFICYCLYVQGQRAFPFLILVGAAGATALADILYGFALLEGDRSLAEVYRTLWVAGFALLLWAALEHSRSGQISESTDDREVSEVEPGEALIPGLSVGAILFAAMAVEWHHLGASVLLFLPLVIGFAGFLAIRERALFSAERHLRTRVEENTRRLAGSEEQLSRVLEHTTDGVIVLDRELRVTYANRTAIKQHFSDRPYLGLPMWQVIGSSPDNEFYSNYRRAMERQTPMRFEAYSTRTERWFEDNVFPAPDSLTIFFRDVTERRRLKEELVRLSQQDPLTDVANRSLFDERLEHGLQSHRRHTDLILVLIDLDGFKEVNDSLGHMAGDSLLQQFARRLTELVRQGDTVARFGGDEFAIIQPGPTEPEGGPKVARRIFEALRTPFDIQGTDVRLTVSIGIAVAPQHGTRPDDLIGHADLALYRAKQTKGDGPNYRIYEPAMEDPAQSLQPLGPDMRRAG